MKRFLWFLPMCLGLSLVLSAQDWTPTPAPSVTPRYVDGPLWPASMLARIEALEKRVDEIEKKRPARTPGPKLKAQKVCKDAKGRVTAAWSAGADDPGPNACGPKKEK